MVFNITKENVKLIGRTCFYGGALWCGLSGSGIAFTAAGTRISITLVGDDTTQGAVTEGPARVGIYADGVRVVDTIMDEPEKSFCVHESEKEKTVTVQVIKLSECAMSTVGIKAIDVEGTGAVFPAPLKKHKIEIIGDSITCGYGVDLEIAESSFSTSTEDVTKTYAYKAAGNLDADYSMVSFSGYGILSGYTDTDEKSSHQLVPSYYDRVGFSYAKPCKTLALQELFWDFHEFEPELIVINLGTNDDSYCKEDKDRQADFSRAYAGFLKKIRQFNPDAVLLCTVGIMEERIFPGIEGGIKAYQEETGDAAVYSMKFTQQQPEDGYVTNFHPTETSHRKAAGELTGRIGEIMGWESGEKL